MDYIEEKQLEKQFAELYTMLEMVDYKYEIHKREAELKVLMENGTKDDLLYLYQEAENEQKEEKKGVISSVVTAIKSLINSIIETVKGFFNKNKDANPNEEIEVNKQDFENTENFINDFEKVKNKITNPNSISEDDEEDVESSMNGLLKYLAFGAAGVGGAATIIKITRGKQKETGEKLNKITEFFNTIIDALKAIPFLGGVIQIIQSILSGIKKALGKIGIFGDKENNKMQTEDENDDPNGVNTKLPTNISNENYEKFLNNLTDEATPNFDTIEKYKDYMGTFKQMIDTAIIDTIDAKVGPDNNVDSVVINEQDILDRINHALGEDQKIFSNTQEGIKTTLENFNMENEIKVIKDQYRSGKRKVKNDVIAKPEESEIAMLSNKKFRDNYYDFMDLCKELNYPMRYVSITNYNALRSIYNIEKVQKVELNNPIYPPKDWLRQELIDTLRDSEGKIHIIDNGSNNKLYHKLSKDDMIKYNDYVKWMKKNHPGERATVINFLSTNGDYFNAENEAKRQMDQLVNDYNQKTKSGGGLKSVIQGFKNKLSGKDNKEGNNQ